MGSAGVLKGHLVSEEVEHTRVERGDGASCPWPPKLSQSEHENLAHHLSPVNSILCHSRLHSFPLACPPTNTHTHKPPRHELYSCREPAVLERPAEVVQQHTPLIPLYRPVLERESGEHAKKS